MKRLPGTVAVVIWALAALSALLVDPHTDPQLGSGPTRYCYTLVNNQPWSCYLEADRPKTYTPVWIGPESEVNTAYLNR